MDMPGMIQIWRWRFLLAVLVFTILLSSLAMLVRHEQSARATSDCLSRLGEKLVQMRIATGEMKQTLTAFRGLLPPDYGSKTANVLLYERVDDLKMLFPGGVMTISAPSEQSGHITLPFSVRAANADYGDFLTGLASAQARTFPFVLINTVSIGYGQSGMGGLEYTFGGTITIPAHAVMGGSR